MSEYGKRFTSRITAFPNRSEHPKAPERRGNIVIKTEELVEYLKANKKANNGEYDEFTAIDFATWSNPAGTVFSGGLQECTRDELTRIVEDYKKYSNPDQNVAAQEEEDNDML